MAYQKISEAEEGTLDSEQNTPLTNIDGDVDSNSAASSSRVLKVVGLVALAAGGAAVVMSSSSSTSSAMSFMTNWYYDDDSLYAPDMGKRGSWAVESYDCSEYDDDTYYTPDLCGQYDYDQCFMGGAGAHDSCNSSYWCSTLCGDMCDEGAGAICFFEKISDLKGTCEQVAALRHAEVDKAVESFSDVSIPGGDDDTLGPTIGPSDPTTDDTADGSRSHTKKKDHVTIGHTHKGTGVYVDDDLVDSGCGRHSYCEVCTGYCKEQAMKHYLESNFGAKGGYSPKSMKMAIIQIINTCHEFGFYTGNTTVL